MRELLRQLCTNAPDFARSWETAKKSGDVEPISAASDWREDLRRKNIEIKTKVPVKTKGPGNPPVVAELFAVDDKRVIVERAQLLEHVEPGFLDSTDQTDARRGNPGLTDRDYRHRSFLRNRNRDHEEARQPRR